jgi:hypothetical protein
MRRPFLHNTSFTLFAYLSNSTLLLLFETMYSISFYLEFQDLFPLLSSVVALEGLSLPSDEDDDITPSPPNEKTWHD